MTKLVDVRDSSGRVFSLTSASQTSTRKFFLSILRSPRYWEAVAAHLRSGKQLDPEVRRCIVAYLRRCDRAEKAQA